MRSLFIAVGCAICCGLLRPASALALDLPQALAGYWAGALQRSGGGVQRLAIDIAWDGSALSGTQTLPEVGMFEQPLDALSYDNGMLTLKCTYGVYHLKVDAGRAELVGVSEDWDPPVTIDLKRTLAPVRHFGTEEVSFASPGATLAGTLYLPLEAGPHPAIVLAHPFGERTRHEWSEVGVCRVLAEHGVAALIFDKRGCGESSGDFAAATFNDFADDVLAGVDLLAQRTDIDAQRIGAWGWSQGGWVIQIAASRDPRIKFLIMRSGCGVSVAEQEAQRVEYSLRADGYNADEIAAAVAYTRRVQAAVDHPEQRAAVLAEATTIAANAWADHVQVAQDEEAFAAWQRAAFDPAPLLRRLAIPVLAMFGENDAQVPPLANIAPLQALLSEAGNQDLTTVVFPHASHSLDVTSDITGADWTWPDSYWAWGRKAPGFYETFLTWLQRRGFAP